MSRRQVHECVIGYVQEFVSKTDREADERPAGTSKVFVGG
jgi:hypothetical protein